MHSCVCFHVIRVPFMVIVNFLQLIIAEFISLMFVGNIHKFGARLERNKTEKEINNSRNHTILWDHMPSLFFGKIMESLKIGKSQFWKAQSWKLKFKKGKIRFRKSPYLQSSKIQIQERIVRMESLQGEMESQMCKIGIQAKKERRSRSKRGRSKQCNIYSCFSQGHKLVMPITFNQVSDRRNLPTVGKLFPSRCP